MGKARPLLNKGQWGDSFGLGTFLTCEQASSSKREGGALPCGRRPICTFLWAEIVVAQIEFRAGRVGRKLRQRFIFHDFRLMRCALALGAWRMRLCRINPILAKLHMYVIQPSLSLLIFRRDTSLRC